MMLKTKGVVLTHTRYGESSAIVHVYTSELGMQSYMVNGAFGKSRKDKIILMQPLNLLEMEVYDRKGKEIQRISEFKLRRALVNIPFSQKLRAQAFLLTEVLVRVLRSEGPNLPLFDFIEEAVVLLDSNCKGAENFHIWFLLRLASFLGFQPHNNYNDEYQWFDLNEGCYVSREPAHIYYLDNDLSFEMHRILNLDSDGLADIAARLDTRRKLLDAVIRFYELHQPGLGKLRSLSVLKELFV